MGAVGTSLAACSLVILALLGIGPHSGRYRVVTVLSGSMGEAAPMGSLVVSTPMPVSQVRDGDVITYSIPVGDRRVVTHRVVEVVEAGAAPVVRTRGDANPGDDPWLARLEPGTAWRARFAVPYAGYAVSFLRQPWLRLVLVQAVPFLLALIWLRDIWGFSWPRRRLPLHLRHTGVRGLAVVTLVGAQVAAGDTALGVFTRQTAATPAPALASATLQPASNLSADGGCGLVILGPKAELDWDQTPSTFATGYKVERYLGATLQATTTVTPRTTTALTVSGLSGNTTYLFKVYAYTPTWTSSIVQDTATTPFLCL